MALSKNSIVAAIRGAFVGDICAMGTHWIYDPKEMATAVPSLEEPEFKTPPAPKYYSAEEFPGHYGAGMLSPYGEQLLFVTEHLAENLEADGAKFSDSFMEWIDRFGGRLDSGMKKMKEHAAEGKKYPELGDADDIHAHAFIKSVVVTCLYAGKPELQAKVEEITRVHQNNERAVAFAAATAVLMESLLTGGSLIESMTKSAEAIEKTELVKKDEVASAYSRAKEAFDEGELEKLMLDLSHELMKDKPDSPFYDLAGRSCALPASFIVPAYLMHKAEAEGLEDAFVKLQRANILASGDTCSRGILIGALIGASTGTVPESWLAKVDPDTMAKIDAAAEKIADHAIATCPAE